MFFTQFRSPLFPRLIRLFPALALTLALGLGAALQAVLPSGAIGAATEYPAEDQPAGISLIALMYHHLEKDSASWGPYVLSPAQFEEDLRYLRDNGFSTISLARLVDYVYGEGELPEKPALITFDDGNESVYAYAYPLLKQYGMTAVVNILGSASERFSENPDHDVNYSYLTWDEIREMKDSGVMEFGNHTYDLHSDKPGHRGVKKIPGESAEEYQYRIYQDIKLNQRLLAEALGEAPIAFAYHFGYQEEEALDILDSLEFRILMGSYEKQNLITRDPACLFPLRRFNRPSGINTWDFFARIAKATP